MTPAQVRMARAALGLSVERLARDAVVSPDAIAALEQDGGEPDVAAKLRATFEGSGIEFLGEDGVRLHGAAANGAGRLPVDSLNAANDE